MEVRQLEIFRTLAQELNFTRTAEIVHTVQSNVTAQIKALEEELGVPLFDRLGKRVTLTDAGRSFLPHAEQALAAMQQGQRSVQSGAEPSGPLRVGVPESMLAYRLPQVLRIFHRRFPHVELIFRPQFDEVLPVMLESGRLDMAVCMIEASPNPSIRSIPSAHGTDFPARASEPSAGGTANRKSGRPGGPIIAADRRTAAATGSD